MLAGEAFPVLAGGKLLVPISYTVATTSRVVQNLRAFLIGQGLWNGTDSIDLTFTIPSGKSVWSNNKAYAAIEVLAADFPADSLITIVNAGLICGKGDWSPAGGALKVTRPLIVNNTGSINGGGVNASGGGAHGCIISRDGGDSACSCCDSCTTPAGGTGYGYGYGSAGSSATTGATGPACTTENCGGGCNSSPGGSGGGPGNNGYCVNGNSFVTWTATGTRNGSIS